MNINENRTIFETNKENYVDVTVSISLYNYAIYIEETLQTVLEQDMRVFDLTVVDDQSTDASLNIVSDWCKKHSERFNRCLVLQHEENSGLSATRNTAFSYAQTPFVFILDADNQIYPRCLTACAGALKACDAAFAYPIIEEFGDSICLKGTDVWSKERLAKGNYIDAMALVRKESWQRVDGYSEMYKGWEDYEFWCKLVDACEYGVQVPEILARYRVHRASMLHTVTNKSENLREIKAFMTARYPWLKLRRKEGLFHL